LEGRSDGKRTALTAPDAERMTVIGNIYDNPELLNSEGTARNGG
jgi:hypothetical protein